MVSSLMDFYHYSDTAGARYHTGVATPSCRYRHQLQGSGNKSLDSRGRYAVWGSYQKVKSIGQDLKPESPLRCCRYTPNSENSGFPLQSHVCYRLVFAIGQYFPDTNICHRSVYTICQYSPVLSIRHRLVYQYTTPVCYTSISPSFHIHNVFNILRSQFRI